MQTLRQRKKAESRQNMLDTAKQLFIKNGYSKTTMEDIAEQAGFGVATLYNYFKTKEGMFAAMAHDDMSEIKAQGRTVLENLPDDPVKGVLALLKTYLKVYDYISYAVMQEFAGVKADQQLRITLTPRGDRPPILCGVEVIAE